MRISTLGYVGKQGFRSIGRNKMFSMASIATMAACIFLFGLFFSVALNMQYIVRMAEESVAITVFFDDYLERSRIDEIAMELRGRPDVAEVNYVSGEEAWESFRQEYFAEHPELAEGFPNNPLVNSNHFEVYMTPSGGEERSLLGASNLSRTQTELVAFAGELEGVRQVNRSDIVANTLSSINVLVGYASAALILILFGVSIFLISNTVTMGITVRREEIAIMKYIGAKDFVVRAPFVIEGLTMGVIGAIIPLILLYFLYGNAVSYIMTRFAILSNIIGFLPAYSVYAYLLPIGLALGVGIGFIGSYFTVRKHLKV
ncbi:MAG: ABC transporter permease [Lachnospiraceae bacterium]|nr:ABC transporter permease [Lachnospiraceae bacterium]